MKREVRVLKGSQIRAKSADKPGASGYAAVFNEITDLGWFREVIKPGAFSRALREAQDVRCLYNHDANAVLGRTKSDTLTLREDSKGLAFECDFPDTQLGRDLRASMDRGDVDQCSFGFIVRKQTWTEEKMDDGSCLDTRTIEDVDLFDVSIVTYPAYEGTSCDVRSLWPEGEPADVLQVRSVHEGRGKEKRAAVCACDCGACVDGDCEDCSNMACASEACRCDKAARAKNKPVTKRVHEEDLTSEHFLIVGDPAEPNTWKLPWKFSTDEKTRSHLQNCLVRFSQATAADEVKAMAWLSLVEKCKAHNIDVFADESADVRARLTPEQIYDFEKDSLLIAAQAKVRAIEASL